MERQFELEDAREFLTRGDRLDQKHMTTDSSEDPYCVCVHVLCEAGEAGRLQAASNQLLSLLRPELQLLRVSERGGAYRPRPKHRQPPHADRTRPPQPSLALILFLHEDHAHSPQRLHGNLLCRHPWIYHHTERVQNPHTHISPHTPSSQDFYTLAPGTPLWAVREVHYGKEVLRLTVYCRYHSYGAMVRLYRLLVGKRRMTPSRHQEGFTCWVLYSTTHTQVQLSLKRLPRDQSPVAMESALLEFRVPDVGGLLPLLPHACHPISALRWQTHDYDNNKILLQSPVRWSRRHTLVHIPSAAEDYEVSMVTTRDHAPCPSAAAVIGRGPASYRHRRYQRSSAPHHGGRSTQTLPAPHRPRPESHQPFRDDQSLEPPQREWEWPEREREWVWRRSRSLPAPPTFRLNVSALVGATETDVDTGRRMSGSCLDLSVVSGYSLPRPRPRPPSHSSQLHAWAPKTHDHHSTHTQARTHTPAAHTDSQHTHTETHTKHVQNTHTTAAHQSTHTHTVAHTTGHTRTGTQKQHTPAHTQHTHSAPHTQHTHTPTQSAEHTQHTHSHSQAHTAEHTQHTHAHTAEHTHSVEHPEEEEQEFYI